VSAADRAAQAIGAAECRAGGEAEGGGAAEGAADIADFEEAVVLIAVDGDSAAAGGTAGLPEEVGLFPDIGIKAGAEDATFSACAVDEIDGIGGVGNGRSAGDSASDIVNDGAAGGIDLAQSEAAAINALDVHDEDGNRDDQDGSEGHGEQQFKDSEAAALNHSMTLGLSVRVVVESLLSRCWPAGRQQART